MLLKIENARVVIKNKITHAELLIEDERIKKIAKIIDEEPDEKINVKNRLVIPGFIDSHVHVRDFFEKYKEDYVTASKAAIAGGVTTILEMPNTKPPITDEITLNMRIELASKKSYVDFGIFFGYNGKNLAELSKNNVRMIKVYMDGTIGNVDYKDVESLLKEHGNNVAISFHAEDFLRIKENREKKLHHLIRDELAEIIAVKKLSDIAKKYKRRIHLCHLSCSESFKYVNEYITKEVTFHHALLTNDLYDKFGTKANVNPPLRSRRDRDFILRMLSEGKIDTIVTDHAPHTLEEKLKGAPGFSSLDIFAKLALTLMNLKIVNIFQLINYCSRNPARIFGLKFKGDILPNYYADLLIVDYKKEGIIKSENFYSKSKFTPFENFKYKGDVEMVILRGEIVYYDDEIIGKKGYGKYVEMLM